MDRTARIIEIQKLYPSLNPDGDPGKLTVGALVKDIVIDDRTLSIFKSELVARELALTKTPVFTGKVTPVTPAPTKNGKGDNIKKPFTLPQLEAYLQTIDFSRWKPSKIVIHHCAAPSLKQRPQGFIQQHMENLEDYYENELGWSGAPHLFMDEDQAWAFNPFNLPGTHATSFNSIGFGIEMLGDYDEEDPWSGRGLQVLTNTAQVVNVLLKFFKLTPADILFHREDPKTTKTCPGTRITKGAFLALLAKV